MTQNHPQAEARDVFQDASFELIKEATGKNPFAFDYLWHLACISRTIDDIYDQDNEVTKEAIIGVVSYLLVELPYNPFYRDNRDTLESQHVSMWNAWVAANAWEDGDETERIYSHVWRDTFHELLPLVALITQGPNKMSEVSKRMRVLFKKQLGD